MLSERKLELIEHYYNKYGNLMPDKNTIFEGVNFYYLIGDIKKLYSKKLLTEEEIIFLEQRGMVWDWSEYKWNLHYSKLHEYYNENGNIDVPVRYVTNDGIRLGHWLQMQKIYYSKRGTAEENASFTEEKIEKLNRLGIVWDLFEEQWNSYYLLAKKYFEENGNLLVPIDYVVEDFTLGRWISIQRRYYRTGNNSRFTTDRIKKLEAIGMVWEPSFLMEAERESKRKKKAHNKQLAFEKKIQSSKIDASLLELHKPANEKELIIMQKWSPYYIAARDYYEKNNNLNIPGKYVFNNLTLGRWIIDTRMKKKKNLLKKWQISSLDKIGMIWDTNEASWLEYFEMAKTFYEENGHLSVLYTYPIDGKDLGHWICNQRRKQTLGTLSKEKEEKLNAIGMIWDTYEYNWNVNYHALKKYIEINGKNVKKDNGGTVYSWLTSQRKAYKRGKLPKDKIAKLEALGISFDPLAEQWETYYLAAKRYFDRYGDLLVPITYKINGLKLGSWINSQRRIHNSKPETMDKERIKKLEAIGMQWELSSNYNKTSFEEQCVYYYVKKYFDDAVNNFKGLGFELDIYIDSTKTGIEYDGEYWHKKKTDRDLLKNQKCSELGVRLIRIREPKCQKLEGTYIEYRLKGNDDKYLEEVLNQMFKNEFNIESDIDIVRDTDEIMDQYYYRIKDNWNSKYLLAKAYYEEHGNLLIPVNTYYVGDVFLGNWIAIQRNAYFKKGKNRISKEQIELLNDIGMIWDVKLFNWMQKYEIAKAYYEEHGNLNIDRTYVIGDFQIGRWLETQRYARKGIHYRITEEQIRLLDEIGMVW